MLTMIAFKLTAQVAQMNTRLQNADLLIETRAAETLETATADDIETELEDQLNELSVAAQRRT